jgi:hypothetical protein
MLNEKEFIMQKILVLPILFVLSACSTTPLTYEPEKNCSPESLNRPSTPISEADKKFYHEKLNDIQQFFLTKLSPQIHQCYQDYLDKAVSPREFAVCTDTTIQDGKVIYVNADDRVNLINDELKVCIESKIKSADWSFIKRKSAISIRQPFMTRVKRQ